MGLIFIDQKLNDKAIEYFRKADKIRSDIGDQYGLSATYLNLSLAYSNLKYPDSVELYIRRAISLKKEIQDLYGLAKAYNNLALHHRASDSPVDSILIYYRLALNQHRSIGNEYGVASTISNMSPIVGEFLNVKMAIDTINLGIEMAEKNGYNELLIQMYWNKALLYSFIDEADSIVKNTILSRNMRDSVEAERNLELITEYETKFQTEKKEKEILRLDAENAESALAISRQRNWMIGIILGFSVLQAIVLSHRVDLWRYAGAPFLLR